jgi:hypothetical protein
MNVATALVAGNDATPQLAEAAVGEALERAGLTHASGVLLYLTPDFARHAAAAVRAASRRANCMQVAGAVVAGLANEETWVFDRPAAAAMVFGGAFSLDTAQEALPDAARSGLRLAMAGAGALPPAWAGLPPRFGFIYSDALSTQPTPAWSHARLAVPPAAEVTLGGALAQIGVSAGVRTLGPGWTVEASHGHELVAVDGRSAADSLRRALPAEYRTGLPLPLHLLAVQPLAEGRAPRHPPRLIPIAAVNPDGSLTLGDPLPAGQKISWVIRQPVSAEADMRATVTSLRQQLPAPPAFALFASCIGRGPYFYGGEDRDWLALRDALPGVPLLGAYGSGQIAPYGHANHLLQNAVVVALCRPRDAIEHRRAAPGLPPEGVKEPRGGPSVP